MLALTFVSSTVPAQSKMLVAQSSHFKVYSMLQEKDLRALTEGLERYDATLRRFTGTSPKTGTVPLSIYVASDEESSGLGGGVLGYYLPSASGPYAVVPQKVYGLFGASLARIVLYHEYAHDFMLQNYPTLYSTWFVEGFAEFYSTVEVGDGVSTLGKPEPLRIHALMGPWRSTLGYLIAPGKAGLTWEQTDDLYARAWLLVHYLSLSKERSGQMAAYLRARSSGQTEAAAFETAFDNSIEGMNSEIKRYFSSHQMPYGSIDVPVSPSVTITEATPGEVAAFKLVPQLRALQSALADGGLNSDTDKLPYVAEARTLAIDARVAVRKLPADADLRVIEAECDLLAKQYDLAQTAADEAIRIDARNSRAYLALAAAKIFTLKAGDHDGLAAARKEIVTANHLSPDDPMPLIFYYRSYADNGETPSAISVQGLERAQQLAPQDDVVRLLLAKEEAKLTRYNLAADLLRPVAFSPHDSPRRTAALTLLKSLPVNQDDTPPPTNAVSDPNKSSATNAN